MDKVSRVLLLYSKLANGERISKHSFCIETDSLPRSFDRDVEDIRLYLSESFSNYNLIYDRKEKVYYFDGYPRRELEEMEYIFVERLLLDSGILRSDEMNGLLTHLALNTEDTNKVIYHKNNNIEQYYEPFHNKAILKMHSDLTSVITNKFNIRIKYIKMNNEIVERDIIPCTMRYNSGYMYLIAFIKDERNYQYPAYFRLDRVYSFIVLGNQRYDEQQRVLEFILRYSKGVTEMYGGKFTEVILSCEKGFYQYVADKFRNSNIVEDKESRIIVSLKVFEEGFVKWILSQPADLIEVLSPCDIKEKIMDKIDRLKKIYSEV